MNWELFLFYAKPIFCVLLLANVAPIMLMVERRGSALMQNRLGPNRLGPLGMLQPVADALKFLFKEDFVPGHVNKVYFFLAPIIAVIPAYMTFAVIPFASSIVIDGKEHFFQAARLDVGMLYIFSVASLGVYGIIMGGWASNSKYALLGGLRSSSQMISYELSLGLSLLGIVMIYSSLDLMEIARAQGGTLISMGPVSLPNWGIFYQPLGALIFLVASYAETNRLPFDLPEGESEIVAGYHLEYGALKFAIFMMAEFVNMTTSSALFATLFLGGWQLLPGMASLLTLSGFDGLTLEWARVGLEFASFGLKVAFLMWLFVWVRWTLPRFRYDQLMSLGWKAMFPIALLNVVVTAALIYWGVL